MPAASPGQHRLSGLPDHPQPLPTAALPITRPVGWVLSFEAENAQDNRLAIWMRLRRSQPITLLTDHPSSSITAVWRFKRTKHRLLLSPVSANFSRAAASERSTKDFKPGYSFLLHARQPLPLLLLSFETEKARHLLSNDTETIVKRHRNSSTATVI